MERTNEQLFERFRSKGDVSALAGVFDRTAAELLRVAIHLAGVASDAEDLVQSTFVTAIENAAAWDSQRSLMPWLIGILNNQARLARRRASRPLDPDRLRERIEASPLEQAQNRELSGELAEAIDGLPEPYRLVVNLSLRHGLSPADIAHALKRSPGTIRVQLHRGLDMLKKALPAGALAALAAFFPKRLLAEPSLDTIRSAVLSHAASVTVPLTVGSLLGAFVMSPKVLIGGTSTLAALTIVLAATGLFSSPDSEPIDVEPPARAELEPLERGSSSTRSLPSIDDEPVTEDQPTRETAQRPTPPETSVQGTALQGLVVDAESGQPLGGVNVRTDRPKLMSGREREMRYPRRLRRRGLRPVIPPKVSDLQALGYEPVPVYETPGTSEDPFAETTTASDGTFMLDCPEAGGILTCELEGYRVSSIAVFDMQAFQEILLHRSSGGHLEGRLITTDGEPLHEPLELRFWDTSGSLTQKRIVTNDDGTFAFDIDAPQVQALCLTPGWYLPFEGIHPQHRQKWAFPTVFFPGREEEPILIVAAREPEALTVLKVTDAVSGDPIESFSMFLRGLDHRMVSMADRYFAPKGELVLVDGAEPFPSWTKHVEMHIWADGHAPSVQEIPDITAAGVIEIALQPEDQPPLEGRITKSAIPVEGAVVSLSCFYALQWHPDSLGKLVATQSASGGRFRLNAPAGEYILRVEHEGADLYQRVVLPGPPLQIDLDHLGSLELVVVDEDSVLQPSHRVSVHDSSGRQMMGDTDETGSAVFTGLAPGRYTASALYEVTRFVLKPHDTREVDLGPGANQRVELQVPVDHGAVFARVVSEGVDRFDGWKVRATYSENREWQPLEASGQIPIDVKDGAMSLLIEEPHGQRWKIAVPANPGPDYTIRLDRGGPGFEGVLLDRSSGTPLTGFRIGVGVRGQGNAITTTSTDDRGHFRLLGVPSGEAYFVFGDQAASESPSSDQWIRFDARAPSNDPPTQLTLHLPRLDGSAFRGIGNRPVTGRVVSKSTGAPVTDAKLFLEAVFEEPSGTFFLKLPSSEPSTNSEGIYRATLPVASEYRGMVIRLSAMRTSTTDRWSAPPSTGEEVHDFQLEE